MVRAAQGGSPRPWALSHRSKGRLSTARPTAPGALPPPPSFCQSLSQRSSQDFGSSHASGHTPTPPWCTPRLRSRTPSQRNTVTCAWCSCWEPGGPPMFAPFPKTQKCSLPQSSCPTSLQVPGGLYQTRSSFLRATLTPPSPTPSTCELATLSTHTASLVQPLPSLQAHLHLLTGLPTPEGSCQKSHLKLPVVLRTKPYLLPPLQVPRPLWSILKGTLPLEACPFAKNMPLWGLLPHHPPHPCAK